MQDVMHHIYSALLMMLPVVIGGVAHMYVVTNDVFPRLKKPVHTFLFGANKTWRGFIVMPLLSIPGAALLQLIVDKAELTLTTPVEDVSFMVLGLALGFAYVLFELPNSFLKRRMGAQPGQVPNTGKVFYVALDQIDSGLGAAIFYYLFFSAPMLTASVYALLFPLVALIVKRGLYMAKLKSSYT